MTEHLTFNVQLVEKELINTSLVEKELININLQTIDLIPRKTYIWELEDIEITDKQNRQVLVYDTSTSQWVNKYLSELLEYYLVVESPTKITAKRFQTNQAFINSFLVVFFNGIKEKNITIINSTTFELPIDSLTSDSIEVKYIKEV